MMLLLAQGRLPRRSARARTQLSPKGVRKIGQLALRDIYQGLLRDRPGGHATDHRGVTELRPDETRAVPLRRPARTSTWSRTLKKALARQPRHAARASQPDDFEVYDDRPRDHHARPCCCST